MQPDNRGETLHCSRCSDVPVEPDIYGGIVSQESKTPLANVPTLLHRSSGTSRCRKTLPSGHLLGSCAKSPTPVRREFNHVFVVIAAVTTTSSLHLLSSSNFPMLNTSVCDSYAQIPYPCFCDTFDKFKIKEYQIRLTFSTEPCVLISCSVLLHYGSSLLAH